MKAKPIVRLYCDGACSGNPGFGGWSCVHYDATDNTIYGAWMASAEETTNNRMELSALIKALKLATTKYKDCSVLIYCDSAYVVNAFDEWIRSWFRNDWITSSKEPVKNLDLIKQIYPYTIIEFPNYGVYKIKGHNNIIGNELADAYASSNGTKLAKILKENDITLAIE